MQLGIFAKTFDGSSPAAVLPQVKAAGFAVAQYNMTCSGLASMPENIPQSITADVQHAAEQSGITLAALSATYNMIHPDVRERDKGHARLLVIAKAASALAIPILTLCTGTRDVQDQWKHHPDNNSASAWADLIHSMQTAIAIADQYNVNLGIEPERGNVVNSALTARQLLDEFKSPRLKIIFDPANLFESEPVTEQRRIISKSLELLRADIAMAHAKDRTANGTFVAAGTGVLDYQHFLSELEQSRFNGPLITHGLTAAQAPRVCEFLKREVGNLVA